LFYLKIVRDHLHKFQSGVKIFDAYLVSRASLSTHRLVPVKATVPGPERQTYGVVTLRTSPFVVRT
jgi:hypothetical protein